MMFVKKTLIAAGALALSTAVFADPQEESSAASDNSNCNLLPGACDTPPDTTHCGLLPGDCGPAPAHWGLGNNPGGWLPKGWGMIAPPPAGFGFIPPLPFAPIGIEGTDEMGAPVYDAKDPSKIIGYIKMRKAPKPTGPVHCMIKETGLLAKSVNDCEAAGGTVAK